MPHNLKAEAEIARRRYERELSHEEMQEVIEKSSKDNPLIPMVVSLGDELNEAEATNTRWSAVARALSKRFGREITTMGLLIIIENLSTGDLAEIERALGIEVKE